MEDLELGFILGMGVGALAVGWLPLLFEFVSGPPVRKRREPPTFSRDSNKGSRR